MHTRHPITNCWVELTNKEWRCTKLAIPTNCSTWQLHVAERNIDKLITIVAERRYDTATMAWLKNQIIAWPRNVLHSPQLFRQYYNHLCSFYRVDKITQQLADHAALVDKMERLKVRRNKDAARMAKMIKKQIEELQKMKRRKKGRRR